MSREYLIPNLSFNLIFRISDLRKKQAKHHLGCSARNFHIGAMSGMFM